MMYLITVSFGYAYEEYNSYKEYPLMIVPNEDTADLVVTECHNPDGMFRQKISETLGYPDGIPDSVLKNCGFSYDEIELYCIQ